MSNVYSPADMVSRVSVLIPARYEEATIPRTLPRHVGALDHLNHLNHLGQQAEAVVVLQAGSPFFGDPPLQHPMVRMVATEQGGESNALRVGVEVADGDVIVPVDADVIVHTDAIAPLVRPLLDGDAGVTAGRVEYGAGGRGWCAIRREYLPTIARCPSVEDASAGLHADEAGASFAPARWAPAMQVQDHAPRTAAEAGPARRMPTAGRWEPVREAGAVDFLLDAPAHVGHVERVETE